MEYVVVGNDHSILIPDLNRFRSGPGRLKGLRCIHTHLHGEPLSQEDLMDLALLKLDLMVCLNITNNGFSADLYYAHILPKNKLGKPWTIEHIPDIGMLDLNFLEFIRDLENQLTKTGTHIGMGKKERAVLVSVNSTSRQEAEESLQELKELSRTNNLVVVDSIIQKKTNVDARFLLGKGKLSELVVRSLQAGANLLIFDGELTPAQVKTLTDATEMKMIDRTQLILDIFSKRAITREGKIQVELAQLGYVLPRLITKNTAMSRLTGGIGGRGPGETKLEINRRRVRDKIAFLNKELIEIRSQRKERRKKRKKRGMPVISIVGYTNAGKSTLLNAFTRSNIKVENRLFVTLDPASRYLRMKNGDAIITDTVGFIKDLPEDLFKAFAATLEELHEADLLLHVADISNSRLEDQIESVKKILNSLDLTEIPTVLVLNKIDRLDESRIDHFAMRLGGIPISAIHPSTLPKLKKVIEDRMF
ncbi:MAG: GTPase HflX [Thermodesulfobacteriota bacterium]